MSDLQKELNGALRLISTLSVSGDAVDIVAAAKQKIRRALELSEPAPAPDVEEGVQNG